MTLQLATLPELRQFAIDKMIKMGGGKKLSASKQRKYFMSQKKPEHLKRPEFYEEYIDNCMYEWFGYKYRAMIATYLYNKDIDNAEKYLQKFIEVTMEYCEHIKKMVDLNLCPEQFYIEECDLAMERVNKFKELVKAYKSEAEDATDDDDDEAVEERVRVFEWCGTKYFINENNILYMYHDPDHPGFEDYDVVEVGYYDPATDRCVYKDNGNDDDEIEGETILLSN